MSYKDRMSYTDRIILVLGMSTLVVACVWMYLWYNKDRYQYVHHQCGLTLVRLVFDKNHGVFFTTYKDGRATRWVRNDCPNAEVQEKDYESK